MRGLQYSPSRKAQELQLKFGGDDTTKHLLRTDALLSQSINLLMRHGEKSKAVRLFNSALDHVQHVVQTTETQLPSDIAPATLYAQAIEQVSPIVETKGFKRGRKAIQIPRALNQRQQNRRGIVWLFDAAEKRSDKEFGKRLGNEIIAVLSGTSQALKRKQEMYKVALANRVNVNVKMNI
jgi:small subunit ribosomal protein S7